MDMDIVNQNLAAAKLSKVKNQGRSLAEQRLKEKELKTACEGFEAIILNTMIKTMRESLPGDALLGESNSTNIYKSMYDEYLAESLSRSHHSIGIKEILYEQLKKSL